MRRNPPSERERSLLVILAAAALMFSSCIDDSEPTSAPPTPTPAPASSPDTPETATPEDDGGRCGDDVYPETDPDRPRYDMTVTMEGSRRVKGRTSVEFTPDLATKKLVFRLWPNGPTQASEGARLRTGAVTVDGDRTSSRLANATTLEVPLSKRLSPGATITADIGWTLTLPGPVSDRLSLDGRSYRLGSFYPVLPWVPGEGWALDPATTSFAEANISPTADYEVRVRVPDGFEVLASGAEIRRGVWRAHEVRDFALAAGPFDVARGETDAPERVKIVVGVDRSLGVNPQLWLEQVRSDLSELADRFGAYPWPTFNLAIMNSLSSAGIEYPTMVFQGPESLGQTTSHELGHMWFYSLVGSNPARDPWLDEGITSWAEATVQDSLSEFASFPIPSAARGQMGRPMTYWDGLGDSTYYFGVYAQPVQALSALGDPAEVNCGLRAYVSEEAFGITEPDDLLESLDPVIPEAEQTLERFGARF